MKTYWVSWPWESFPGWISLLSVVLSASAWQGQMWLFAAWEELADPWMPAQNEHCAAQHWPSHHLSPGSARGALFVLGAASTVWAVCSWPFPALCFCKGLSQMFVRIFLLVYYWDFSLYFNLPNGLTVVMPKAPPTLIRFFWLWRLTGCCCPCLETSRDVWRCTWNLWLNPNIRPSLLFLRLILNQINFSVRPHIGVYFDHSILWTFFGAVLVAFCLAWTGGGGALGCSECLSSDFYPQQLLILAAESRWCHGFDFGGELEWLA